MMVEPSGYFANIFVKLRYHLDDTLPKKKAVNPSEARQKTACIAKTAFT